MMNRNKKNERVRVFIKVQLKEETLQFVSVMDKTKHALNIESYLSELFDKISQIQSDANKADFLPDPLGLRLWLAPNHQLLTLDPIEKDDLLVVGTSTDLK